MACRPDGTVHTVWGYLEHAVSACIRNGRAGWYVRCARTRRTLWRMS